MTTTTAIIKRALRESNNIRIGATPTDDQNTEGMELLAGLVAAVYGYEAGERLEDWLVGGEGLESPDVTWTEQLWKYPLQNTRILLNHDSAQTLYLPPDPDNGARIQVVDTYGVLDTYSVIINGNGRLIEEAASVTLVTADTNKSWSYSAETNNWVLVEALALDDEMPFPIEFDDYFVTKLAARLNPRYGRSLSDLSVAMMLETQEKMESRYRQRRPMPTASGPLNLTDVNRPLSAKFRRGRYGWMN